MTTNSSPPRRLFIFLTVVSKFSLLFLISVTSWMIFYCQLFLVVLSYFPTYIHSKKCVCCLLWVTGFTLTPSILVLTSGPHNKLAKCVLCGWAASQPQVLSVKGKLIFVVSSHFYSQWLIWNSWMFVIIVLFWGKISPLQGVEDQFRQFSEACVKSIINLGLVARL